MSMTSSAEAANLLPSLICSHYKENIYSIFVMCYAPRPLLKVIFNCFIVLSGIIGACLLVACDSSPSQKGNQPPVISTLSADPVSVYPLGKAKIQCSAYDPDGDSLSYRWVCNDGLIAGSGPSVTWEAPASYGDYHIMVMVEDKFGNVTKQVASVAVIVRETDKHCLSCPK
jgi:hypothetical protein